MIENIRSRHRWRDLFSIEEFAEFLGVSVRTVRRMQARHATPARIHRSRREVYPAAEVIAWLEGHSGQRHEELRQR